MDALSPFIRILLRYAAGIMLGRGLIDFELANVISTDPDLAASFSLLVGAVLGAISEMWYKFAKRMGWST